MTAPVVGAGHVGRYFTVVSALPASVFVLYVYLIAGTDPWSGSMNWSALADFHAESLVIAGIAALVLALALNPLQLTLIQLLEGYWGHSRFAVELALIRRLHHERRHAELTARTGAPDTSLGPVQRLRTIIAAQESQRALASYPKNPHHFLPTRLGNVLRTYETSIGAPYKLDPLVVVPRLAMVAGDRELDYVRDQRTQMELAIRTCLLAAVAVPVTVVLLWNQGLWLLLAVLPYAVTYLTYRGTVAIAHEYGMSLAVLIDMARFDLYRRQWLPDPKNTEDERLVNERLMDLFRFLPNASVPYEKPTSPSESEPTTPPSVPSEE